MTHIKILENDEKFCIIIKTLTWMQYKKVVKV